MSQISVFVWIIPVRCSFGAWISSVGGGQTTGLTGSCFPLQTDRQTVLWTPTCVAENSRLLNQPAHFPQCHRLIWVKVATPPLRDWTQLEPPKRDSTVPGALKTHTWTHKQSHRQMQPLLKSRLALTLVAFNLLPKEKFLGEKSFFFTS